MSTVGVVTMTTVGVVMARARVHGWLSCQRTIQYRNASAWPQNARRRTMKSAESGRDRNTLADSPAHAVNHESASRQLHKLLNVFRRQFDLVATRLELGEVEPRRVL